MATGVQGFVVSKMGERFIKPPVFDLNACFDDSSCVTPLVFILSPGSDPMGAVLKAAEDMGVKVPRLRCSQKDRYEIMETPYFKLSLTR